MEKEVAGFYKQIDNSCELINNQFNMEDNLSICELMQQIINYYVHHDLSGLDKICAYANYNYILKITALEINNTDDNVKAAIIELLISLLTFSERYDNEIYELIVKYSYEFLMNKKSEHYEEIYSYYKSKLKMTALKKQSLN